jgi:tetratricopeptide (TPR) repeat protein
VETIKPRSQADKRFNILLTVQGVTLVAIIFTVFFARSGGNSSDAERSRLLRDTAAKLQSAGLSAAAIEQYEEFLKEPGIPGKTRASISFSLGEMNESLGRPEKALAWYYQVEGSDPNAPEQKEASKKIVALLETLGRHQAASAVLSSATSLDKKESTSGTGKVVAEVGDKTIFAGEITESLDALPPQVKPSFEGAAGKEKFLKKYIADELLLEKAKRLQYDSDPKFLKQMEEIRRQLLVGRILNEEVLSRVIVDEKDLKNYFEANKSRYADNKKKTQSFDKVKQAVEQDYRAEKSQTKYQELIEQLVKGDHIKLYTENLGESGK